MSGVAQRHVFSCRGSFLSASFGCFILQAGVVGFRNLIVKKPMTAMCGYLAPPDGSVFESLEST